MPGFTVKVDGNIANLSSALRAAESDLKSFQSKFTGGVSLGVNASNLNTEKLKSGLTNIQKEAQSTRNSLTDLLNAAQKINDIPVRDDIVPPVRSGVSASYDRVSRSINAMGQSINSIDPTRLSKGVAPVPAAVPASISKVGTAAGRANSVIIDFSRTINDIPFGLVGIANNISPLLEGFGRLKTETGSAGGALKAMAGSLIGPAGLGLAINLVTSAFIIYQNGIAGFNKKTKEAADKAKDFIETLKDVATLSSEAAASEEGNVSKVKALADAVLNQSNSYQVRNSALKELQNINKNYFGDLTLEQSKLGLLTAAVDEYVNAIKAQAVLKGFTDEIGRVSVEMAKQDSQLKKLQTTYEQAQAKLAKTPLFDTNIQSGGFAAGTGGQISSIYRAAKQGAESAKKAFDAQRGVVEQLATNYAELNGQIDAATKKTLEFKSLETDPKGKTDKTDPLKKQLEAYERILATVNDINEKVDIGEKILDLKVRILLRDAGKQGLTGSEVAATIKGFQDDFQTLLNQQAAALELSPKVKFSNVIKVDIPNNISFFITNAGTVETKLNDEVSKALGLDKKIPVVTLHEARVKLLGANVTAEIEGKEQLQKNVSEAISGAFTDLKVEGLAGIGELLAGALEGGSDGLKNAAKNMMATIGGIIGQLGKFVILTAIKMQALKAVVEKWIIANPVAAIAAGVGMVALGSVLKNAVFSGPKLAEGGITTGPTFAQIGERGREAIVPLNKLPQLIGQAAGSAGGRPSSVGLAIRGRELYAFLMEEGRQFNRNF